MKSPPYEPPPSEQDPDIDVRNTTYPDTVPYVEKDVFYYDLPTYLLNIIVERQLEDEGLSDAEGLGTGMCPFDSVYIPCVREVEEGYDTAGFVESNGLLVCKEPDDYLFWDAFRLGGVANEMIGREVAAMIKDGNSMRKIGGARGKPA